MSTQTVKQHLEAAGGGILSERAAEQKQSLLIEDDERWYAILDAAFDPKVQLHRLVTLSRQHQMEDGDLSTSSLTDEMNATAGGEDCEGAETRSKSSQDDSHFSETEVMDHYYYYDDDDDDDDDDSDSQLKQLSETGPKTVHSDEQKSTNTVKIFSCSECGKQFVNKQSLQNHVLSHERRFAISFVEKTCVSVKAIVDSCRTVQAVLKLYRCDHDVSDNNRKTDTGKQIHKVHAVKKPFKCDECERSYSNKGNLARHMKDHTEKKPFRCDECERSYCSKGSLTRHMKDHTVKKSFRCDERERTYSRKESLARHMNVHTVKKLFRCDVCERSYCSKGSLTKHMIVHTVKLFRCNVCDRCYCAKGSLTRHMIVHTQ